MFPRHQVHILCYRIFLVYIHLLASFQKRRSGECRKQETLFRRSHQSPPLGVWSRFRSHEANCCDPLVPYMCCLSVCRRTLVRNAFPLPTEFRTDANVSPPRNFQPVSLPVLLVKTQDLRCLWVSICSEEHVQLVFVETVADLFGAGTEVYLGQEQA